MSEKWEAKIIGPDAYVRLPDGNHIYVGCSIEDAKTAAQIAREHNTHAALVEALEEALETALECGLNALAERLDAALAAAKGATSEHR